MNKVQGSQIDEIKKGYEKALKGLDDSARAEFFKAERERINTKELKELAKHIAGGAAAYYQGSWDFLGKDTQAANLERKETNELIKKRFDELGIRGVFDLESQKQFVQPKEFIDTSQWLSFEPTKLSGFVEGLKQNAGKTAGAMVGGLATAAVLATRKMASAALNKNVVLAKNLEESVLPNLSKSNLVLTKFKTPNLTPLRKLAQRINATTNLVKRGGFYTLTNGEGLSNGDYARRRAAFAELEENGR